MNPDIHITSVHLNDLNFQIKQEGMLYCKTLLSENTLIRACTGINCSGLKINRKLLRFLTGKRKMSRSNTYGFSEVLNSNNKLTEEILLGNLPRPSPELPSPWLDFLRFKCTL